MKRAAFVHWGSFSHMNERLLRALREVFPGYELDSVDVRTLMRPEHDRLAFKLRSGMAAHQQFGRLLLTRREKLRGVGGCLIRTTVYFDRVRRLVAEYLASGDYTFTLQTQSFYAANLPDVPHFVYTDHAELQCLRLPGFSPKSLFPSSWIRLEASIYRNAAMVFTMSEATRTCLIADYGCPESQVASIRAGANAEAPDRASVPPDRYAGKRIVFVGTRWESKGGPELAAAFRRVLRVHADARLTVVGCSPPLDLRHCDVVGRVPLDRVRAYLNEASVFCVPTRREAFGNAFIEALAHGLPVVATKVGAIPEYVLEGITGSLVEVGDVDGLTSRLIALLDDPAECRRLGDAGRSLARSRYTWAATARAMQGHIEAQIGGL